MGTSNFENMPRPDACVEDCTVNGRPQHPSRAADVSRANQRANSRARNLQPSHADRRLNVHGESKLLAHCDQLGHARGGAAPEAEVLPFVDAAHAERRNQNLIANSRGDRWAETALIRAPGPHRFQFDQAGATSQAEG